MSPTTTVHNSNRHPMIPPSTTSENGIDLAVLKVPMKQTTMLGDTNGFEDQSNQVRNFRDNSLEMLSDFRSPDSR